MVKWYEKLIIKQISNLPSTTFQHEHRTWGWKQSQENMMIVYLSRLHTHRLRRCRRLFCSLQEGCIAVMFVCKVKPKKSSRIFVLRRDRRRVSWGAADVLMSYCIIFINMQRCSSCICQVTQRIMEGTWINGMTMIMI